uniref:Uncharacterized protein n=1 Tax=Meloidogyne incognita TaxID=6306 RepID=A0A914LH99_MELIC
MGLIALIVHCFAKDLFKAAVASLMDMCFFIFSVVILVISTVVFLLKTISLYRWLRPKLANFNYTLEAYADITEIDMRKHKTWGLEGYTLELIEGHKKEIIINVLINPIMTVLTAVTLILNIYLIFCLYKKMCNAKLWNDGVQDYLALFPKCSPIEMKYARLGKSKMFQWLLPLSPLLAYIYVPIFRNDRHTSVRFFWAPTIIYLIDWLLYYTTIHLRYSKGQIDKAIRLPYLFFTDLILSFFFTILFIICAVTMGNDFENIFFIILIIFYGCYTLQLSFIYLRNKKGLFDFKLPTSIKINFEINFKSEKEQNKVIEEKLEKGDEKKEENGWENK